MSFTGVAAAGDFLAHGRVLSPLTLSGPCHVMASAPQYDVAIESVAGCRIAAT